MECHVCKKLIQLDTETTYIAYQMGEREHFFKPYRTAYFDATDCSYCGCQNILGARLPKSEPKQENVTDISTSEPSDSEEQFLIEDEPLC